VLAQAGGVCQVGGPRCTIRATEVHHRLPTSVAPHAFYDPRYLIATCAPCHNGDADSALLVGELERLQALVDEQAAELERLRVPQAEPPARVRQPRID
jgi:hypothetical protein